MTLNFVVRLEDENGNIHEETVKKDIYIENEVYEQARRQLRENNKVMRNHILTVNDFRLLH